MTPGDLRDRIRAGEDSRTEFKDDRVWPDELASALVAFANSAGGLVLLGVGDDRSLRGVSDPDLMLRQVDNISRNNIEPPLSLILVEKVELDSRIILVIEIVRGPQRPYRTNRGQYYLRTAAGRRLATRQELLELYQSAEALQPDELPAEGAGADELDQEYLQRVRPELGDLPAHPLRQALINMKLLTASGHPTIGGLLCFGRNPQQARPYARVTAIRHKGTQISEEFLDREELNGCVEKQIVAARAFLRRHLGQGASTVPSSIYPAPVEAVEEALVNAVAHRDYLAQAQVRVFVYDDRVQIISPGRLLNSVNVELRYLAMVAAAGQAVTCERLGLQERLLPIHANVAALLQCQEEHADDPPERLFARVVAGATGVSEAALAGAIRDAGSRSRVLFLLDGLDEVSTGCGVRAAASLIERLAHDPRLRRHRWIVSCRPLGYPGLTLPGGVTPFVLEPLSREAIRPMLRSYLTELFRGQGAGPAEAERAATQRADQLAHGWESHFPWAPFARSPLLLALAVQLGAQQVDLIPSRVLAFDLATKALVDSWAQARRDAESPQPARGVDYEREGRVVLPGLALHLHENRPSGRIPEGELLLELTKRVPADTGVGASAAGVATLPARDFLQRLEAAGALLRETGRREWAFLHRSFQDFLSARHLVQEGSFFSRLASVKYLPQWREIVRMTVGELAVIHLRGREAAEFVQSILADARDWHNAELHKGLVVAALCAAEVPRLNPDLDRAIVDRLEDAIRGRPEAPGLPEAIVHATLRQLRDTPVAAELSKRLAADPNDRGRLPSRPRAALAELGAPQATDLLLADLRSAVNVVWVAQDLGRLRRPEVLPELRKVLADESLAESVRWAAALALGSLADGESIPHLRKLLAEPSADRKRAHLRGGAVLALGRLQCREIVPALLDGLAGRDATFPRTQAVYALATMRVQEAQEVLLRILRSEPPGELRRAAVRALGEIGDARASSALLDLLRDPNTGPSICEAAALALSALGTQEVLPTLLDALRRPPLPRTRWRDSPPRPRLARWESSELAKRSAA
ncbi:MAG: HEAT repeat domain-containing protein [Planctomycetes bacterium]|nr:HEAT repeat domain-containing protein [Planctomycetota bacterium]